jgi:hypothetical protein
MYTREKGVYLRTAAIGVAGLALGLCCLGSGLAAGVNRDRILGLFPIKPAPTEPAGIAPTASSVHGVPGSPIFGLAPAHSAVTIREIDWSNGEAWVWSNTDTSAELRLGAGFDGDGKHVRDAWVFEPNGPCQEGRALANGSIPGVKLETVNGKPLKAACP